MNTTTLFLFRHGETEWALSGKHTGCTDIPLTDKGRQQAAKLKDVVHSVTFSAVLSSPRSRALDTAKLAGFENIVIDDDLAEVDYGDYEGITTAEIRKSVPGWTVWTHPCLNGETLSAAAARATKVIKRAEDVGGNVAIFSHGHMLRVLVTAWLQLDPAEGRRFMLDTSTVSILSHEHESRTVKVWNAPIDMIACMQRLAQSTAKEIAVN
jgi:broad specificity phosphatase PhoE